MKLILGRYQQRKSRDWDGKRWIIPLFKKKNNNNNNNNNNKNSDAANNFPSNNLLCYSQEFCNEIRSTNSIIFSFISKYIFRMLGVLRVLKNKWT